MLDEIFNNLGIYKNINNLNESSSAINKHIEQGQNFINFANEKKDDSSLFVNDGYTVIEGLTNLPFDNIFNTKLTDYKTAYTTFKNIANPTQMQKDALNAKYNELVTSSNSLITTMNTVRNESTSFTSRAEIDGKIAQITEIINDYNNVTPDDVYAISNNIKINDTLNGKIESTTLQMTSTYYHYIVYFLVSVTILGMTFYLFVNPDADVMKASYVVGGILAVYFISKFIGK